MPGLGDAGSIKGGGRDADPLRRMKRCPNCGYIVPAAWTECRRCAAPLDLGGAAPPPVPARVLAAVPAAPPDDALLPGGTRVNGHPIGRVEPPRDTGPDTWLPAIDPDVVIKEAAPAKRRVKPQTIVIGAGIVLLVVAIGFTTTHHGHKAPSAPTVLAPREPFAGIPTSLSDVVRVEAESSRHTALSVIISGAGPSGAALTTAQLDNLQPGYQWLLGSQPSTTNTQISVSSAPGADVIAVSGTNREICAFGRWSPAAGPSYVTMANVPSCTATAAPQTGWSPIPGGAASDLPNDLGS